MNENETQKEDGFFRDIASDDGVQRAAAGIVVAIVVASAKRLIFGSGS